MANGPVSKINAIICAFSLVCRQKIQKAFGLNKHKHDLIKHHVLIQQNIFITTYVINFHKSS